MLLFAGAPEVDSLDWDDANLLKDFSGSFSRFAGHEVADQLTAIPHVTSFSQPAWRSLSLQRQHLTTGLSQSPAPHGDYRGFGASFFTTHDVDSFLEEWCQSRTRDSQELGSRPTEQVLSQFYEQSYAVHEDIPSSQLGPVLDDGISFRSGTSFGVTDSFDSTSYSFPRDVPSAGPLTNLKDVPTATYLSSIHPQTMTINLIAGIISISPPRTINVRRGGTVELIEVLIGDDTRSGFGINFWLHSSQAKSELRSVLEGLRPQDIILVRNVALTSFRGKVYGQSLRKDTTKAHLYYRNRIDKSDTGGYYSAADLVRTDTPHPQVEKTIKVREWVMKFVGGAAGQSKRDHRRSAIERLPPDTQ